MFPGKVGGRHFFGGKGYVRKRAKQKTPKNDNCSGVSGESLSLIQIRIVVLYLISAQKRGGVGEGKKTTTKIGVV